MSRLAEVHSNIIGTRANEEKFAAVKKQFLMRNIIKTQDS